jgi:hypothetical protein
VEEKARAKEVLRQIIVPSWRRRKTSSPIIRKTRTTMMAKENLMAKNMTSQSTNFKNKNDKKKSVCHVYSDPGIRISLTPLTSVVNGRAARPPILSLEILR